MEKSEDVVKMIRRSRRGRRVSNRGGVGGIKVT